MKHTQVYKTKSSSLLKKILFSVASTVATYYVTKWINTPAVDEEVIDISK